MAKFEVKNSEGKKVAEAELAAEVYGIEPNIHVMHHIVKCQMASWRQGTQSAKGRSEVSGVTVALSSPPSPVPTLSV